MAATDQIRQMVNFILQEAHEKANEIRVKVSKSAAAMPDRRPRTGTLEKEGPDGVNIGAWKSIIMRNNNPLYM